jgi:hypothetical protein
VPALKVISRRPFRPCFSPYSEMGASKRNPYPPP